MVIVYDLPGYSIVPPPKDIHTLFSVFFYFKQWYNTYPYTYFLSTGTYELNSHECIYWIKKYMMYFNTNIVRFQKLSTGWVTCLFTSHLNLLFSEQLIKPCGSFSIFIHYVSIHMCSFSSYPLDLVHAFEKMLFFPICSSFDIIYDTLYHIKCS